MITVVLIIHLMIAAALVAVVLLQRSEGGALGIGGSGGFMSSRGTANLLTRTTSILAAAFFATSIVLTILANRDLAPKSILEGVKTDTPATAPAETKQLAPAGGGILDKLQKTAPQVPQSQ